MKLNMAVVLMVLLCPEGQIFKDVENLLVLHRFMDVVKTGEQLLLDLIMEVVKGFLEVFLITELKDVNVAVFLVNSPNLVVVQMVQHPL